MTAKFFNYKRPGIRKAGYSRACNKSLSIIEWRMEDLTGKVAIVTGASSGIGEAIARLLVIVGVHVIGLARTQKDLQAVANSLKGNKGTFDSFPGDVRIEKDLLDVFAYADYKYGGLDILVNNAGILYLEDITNSSTDHLRNTLYTDALAGAITNREAVRHMVKRKRSGHIVNIISVSGLDATLFNNPLGLYSSSKFALHAITEGVRQEITQKSYPIKVTGIYPYAVNTPLNQKAGLPANFIETIPHLEPEDIADAVLYALEVPSNIQINRVVISPLS